MNFNITTIIAIYGAVLSTLALIMSAVALVWNIRKDLNKKGRFKLKCYIETAIHEIILINYEITNIGKEPLSIKAIGGTFIDKQTFLMINPFPDKDLPYILQPNEKKLLYTDKDFNKSLKQIKSLYVEDTLDKRYEAPQKEIKTINKVILNSKK